MEVMPIDISSSGPAYNLEAAIDHIGIGVFQWRLVIILGFCTMSDAIEMMLLAILGPALTCDWNITQWQVATLTTSVFFGMMCGAFLFGWLADKYGRKKVIITSAVLNTTFGILTAFSPSYHWVVLARVCVGFALSGAAQGATLMLEFLPSTYRATIVIVIELFWSLGAILEYLMAMYVIPPYGWRTLTILSALPISIVAVCMYFIPESPRYYLASGNADKAEMILKTVALTNKRALPPGKILDGHIKEECGSFSQLFHFNYKRTTFLLTFMWITVAMSYYGLILINTSIFTMNVDVPSTSKENCKMLTDNDYKSLILTTFGEMAGIPLLLLLLSKFGRRAVSVINFTSASICFSLLFVARNTHWAINTITFLARMFINSQFSLLYLYTMEVYPTVVRAIAVGSASSMARVGAMITPFLAQVLIKHTFIGTILVYTIATGMAAFCAFLLPIETRGRELKQSPIDIPSEQSSPSALDQKLNVLESVDGGFVNKTYSSMDHIDVKE